MARYRFSGFEVDEEFRELRRNGHRVPLQPQPFQILCLLLASPGRAVSRATIMEALWGGTHLADADRSLNIAIRKLRTALDDSAETPRILQTIPRQGYCLVAPVEVLPADAGNAGQRAVSHVQTDLHDQDLPDPASPRNPDAERQSVTEANAERPQRQVPESADAIPPTGFLRTRWRWLAAAVLLPALGAFVFWWYQTSVPQSREDNLVLVAAFEDNTGETDLAGAYEVLLESELTASGHGILVSPDRVGDTLRLMRKPPIPRPSLADAMDVARRDSAIRAVVGGELRRVDNQYLLSLRLLSPESGGALISLNGAAGTRTELVSTLRELAMAIRERMGESLSQSTRTGQALDPVTTQSLQALKRYSEAHALARQGNWAAAEVLLRQAVELDPGFPSALNLLAWAIYNQRYEDTAAYLPLADRALALVNPTSEQEALFIRGSWHLLRHEYAASVPFHEALLQRFPQHPWAVGNLMNAYSRTGQRNKALQLVRRLPEIRPQDARSYQEIASWTVCAEDGAPSQLREAADRYLELSVQSDGEHRSGVLRTHLAWHAVAAWMEGDLTAAKHHLDEAALWIEREPPGGGGRFLVLAGYLALGKRKEAESLAPAGRRLYFRDNWALWPALFAGDHEAATRIAQEMAEARPHPMTAIALLRAGETSLAAKLLQRQVRSHPSTLPAAIEAAEGELALRQGRVDDAIRTLEAALTDLSSILVAEDILAAQALAEAYRRKGQPEKAIRALERVTERPRACGGFYRAAFWLHARADLMELYRQHGRLQEAEAIRQDLTTLVALADDDFVLKKRLARLPR